MKHAANWEATQERFKAWWNRSKVDRPLMYVVATRSQPLPDLEEVNPPSSPDELYTDVERIAAEARNYMKTHSLYADALPYIDANLGPGSLSLYIGSEPEFAWDTVWYKECVDDWTTHPSFKFDTKNLWWKKHYEMISKLQEMSQGDFLVTIPDLIENVDILSAMRGPQAFCYDLIDEPEAVKKFINQVDDLYFKYYDAFYDVIKGQDGSISFTAFKVWGPGKTAKIQCDFCAMMSPSQFREFVQPSLRKQCQQLDNSIYHLDGPDAVRHLDALMEIEELDAIQWTSGAGQPDGASELWYPIYDKVKAAGKSLWVAIHDGNLNDWIESGNRIVQRYGSDGLYLLFYAETTEAEAAYLVNYAEKNW